jgi:putative hydrolase of the HAD superfamily
LKNYFSAFFSSCYLGLRKPSPEIYLRGLDVLQCAPERAVFTDDREENVAAAASVGIHAIQMRTPAQLREDFRRLGVIA